MILIYFVLINYFIELFCNAEEYNITMSTRIVGGNYVDISLVPYQLSLQENGTHVCGAAIISADWAITAAHCVYGSENSNFTIRAGSNNPASGGQLVDIKEIYVHPKYDDFEVDYDLALLKLASKLHLNKRIKPIEMVKENVTIVEGTMATISGWGTTSENDTNISPNLKMAEVPIVNMKQCKRNYRGSELTKRMLCAGYKKGGTDSCQGDSGGPLVAHGKLIGIVSWGKGCARRNKPGVYTNLAKLRGYVRQVTSI